MKSTLFLTCFLLSSALLCFSQNRSETRIIGNLNTGKPVATATAKVLPNFQVQGSRTHRVGERNVTVQKVAPPESAVLEPEVEVSRSAIQPKNTLNRKSRNIPSAGLIFLTALPAKGGGYDLEIGLNGEWLKAWTSAEVRYLSGFTEFIANGRRYHVMGLPVAGDILEKEKPKSRRAGRGKREPAPRYFLTKFEGDEQTCRTLLKDLHDLYHVERHVLRWAYRERSKNQAKREAELKANPPKKQDVIIRYWKTPVKK